MIDNVKKSINKKKRNEFNVIRINISRIRREDKDDEIFLRLNVSNLTKDFEKSSIELIEILKRNFYCGANWLLSMLYIISKKN